MIIVKIRGGLGNQLFQYATGLRAAINNSTILKLDLEAILDPACRYKYRLDMLNIEAQRAEISEINQLKNMSCNNFVFSILNRLNINCRFRKKTHFIENSNIQPDLRVIDVNNDMYLDGWFGSPFYFEDIKDRLLNEFKLKFQSNEYNKLFLNQIKESNSVSLHIRRGDYTENSYFGLLSLEYYENAIKLMNKLVDKPTYFIFSNDINWARENLNIDGSTIFMDGNSENSAFTYTQGDYEDFNLMCNCNHHIIANSTFSWWGAWLADRPNKVVIAPKIWYRNKEAQKVYENSDLIPSEWIKV